MVSLNGLKIFAGSAHQTLAKDICAELDLKLGNSDASRFSDGEISLSIYEPVRGSDVFIIQPTCYPVNENLMELLIMIDAMRRASAGRITAVIPYFGYSRQDRKAKSRDPISAKLVANILTSAGADRVLTMDLHAAQIQGFFDIPVDNLFGRPLFTKYFLDKFGKGRKDLICVSPDAGSAARTRSLAESLDLGMAIVDKRHVGSTTEVLHIIGDVKGKKAILIDDMVDTAGSLCNAAEALVTIGGAESVYACASHGVLSGKAMERINASRLEELVLLDTIPPVGEQCEKIKRLSIAWLFGEAIRRIHTETSISPLYTAETAEDLAALSLEESGLD